jgi:two-component system, response regulator PdtaR
VPYLQKTQNMEEKFKILIVEDELLVAKDISTRLQQKDYEIVGISDNCDDAVRLFQTTKPDLVLLDITIKGDKDGIKTAQEIYKIRPTPFIYLTAHTDTDTLQRAKNTFPTAYLVKPFTTNNLMVSIELALHNFAYNKFPQELSESKNDKIEEDLYSHREHIFIKDGQKFLKINTNDIYYIESDDNYVKIYTKTRMIHSRTKITDVLEKLGKKYFVRVHRSFCVNINHIEYFTEQEISIFNTKIPIGRNHKENFVACFDLR